MERCEGRGKTFGKKKKKKKEGKQKRNAYEKSLSARALGLYFEHARFGVPVYSTRYCYVFCHVFRCEYVGLVKLSHCVRLYMMGSVCMYLLDSLWE
jgi:hypothetical protein